MTSKVSKRDEEISLENNLECSRCGTSLPQRAFYCSTCGKRIVKSQNHRKKIQAKGDEAEFLTQNENGAETLRLAELPRRVREYYASRALYKTYAAGKDLQNNVSEAGREAPVKEEMLSSPSPDSAIEDNEQISFFHRFRRLGIPQAPKPYPRSVSQTKPWKWLAILSLTIGIGLLLVADAFEAGRLALPLADPLFWTGLVIIYVPIAVRIFSVQPTRRERLALLVSLAVALYLIKFLQYPINFAYFDEFIHVRTAQDIITSGHLFQPNPILPLSPYFPGLEIIISSLSSLTGLSIFVSGILLIGVVQLLTVMALYHFYKLLIKSDRIASIATVLYMANPGFLFDTAFAYESLALSLAVFVLFVVALRCFAASEYRKGLTPVIWLAIGAVAVTHHLTSFTLTGLLLFWTCASLFLRVVGRLRRNRNSNSNNWMSIGPGEAGILALALCVLWQVLTAGNAVGYLAQYPIAAIQEILQVLSGHASTRQLFHSSAGAVIPRWEPLISYSSIALILAGLVFGVLQIWRHYRTRAVFLMLAGIALIYPVSLGFHLIPQGAEMASRATEFAFLGIAFLLAVGVVSRWMFRSKRWRHPLVLTGLIGVVFLGQLVTGNGQVWARIPGPYLVVADQRSIEPEGINAAIWAAMNLGPGHRIATDRINMLLMSTYGNQWVTMAWNSNASVQSIFTEQQFGPAVWTALQQDEVQYVAVDRRLSTGMPVVGVYFDIPWTASNPIALSGLTKFDGVVDVSRVFDSGDIVIYDVTPLTNITQASLTPHALCAPTPSSASTLSTPKAQNYQGTLYDAASSGITTTIQLNGTQQQSGAICGTFKVTPNHSPIAGIPTNGTFGAAIASTGQVQLILTGTAGTISLNVYGQTTSGGTIEGTYCSIQKAANACSNYGVLNVSPVR